MRSSSVASIALSFLRSASSQAARTAGIDDGLANVVHGSADTGGPPAQYATLVRSVLANGAMAKGIARGIEIAQVDEICDAFVRLNLIRVDDHRDVRDLLMRGGLQRFPDLSLL